jgi:hypothetical protein
MKSTLVVGSFLLGSLVAFGQVSGRTPGTTPPTFPQDQSQSQSQPGAKGVPDQTDSQSSAPMTSQSQSSATQNISGCLHQAGSSGGYTLSDRSGNVYQLTGDNTQLSKFVNNEVQISGSMSAPSSTATAAPGTSTATSTTGGATGGTAAGAQNISVSSVQKISDTCTSKAQPSPR